MWYNGTMAICVIEKKNTYSQIEQTNNRNSRDSGP